MSDKAKVVYEEDIETAVEKAVGVFGPQGRLLYGGKIIYNAKVSTKEHGVIWYGDLEDSATLVDSLMLLERELGVQGNIVSLSFNG